MPRGKDIKDFEIYEVGLLEGEIFRDLINSAKRPGTEGALDFAKTWGLLMLMPKMALAHFLEKRSAFIDVFERGHRHLARLLDDERQQWASVNGPPLGLGPLHADYTAKTGKPGFCLRATTLLQFCVLELIQAEAGGVDLTMCEACQKLLPIHRTGRPKRHCNDRCKTAAYRRRQQGT
jgi:hypothetical protein